MNLTWIDWAIVAAYFLLSAGIGFAFTKKGGESLSEYFISGRAVPWWLAGASMVATTFAADTPLVVTGLVSAHGVAGNWLWWNMLMSGMLTVFFFARLWRRANVMTDVEFAEVRYSGKPAATLRVFRALYLAIPINLIILGWVTRAMIKILTISLGLHPVQIGGVSVSGEVIAVGICFVITMAYSVAAGMWAVLWTDLVQFVIKMTAVIVLAVYAVSAVGGMAVMKTKLVEHFGSEKAAISVLPISFGGNGITAYAWMPILSLAVFLGVQWWAAWYPGAEPGGGGYVAQRIFSARTERDGVLATLAFNVAHYALRPWPWIITGLATVILYPNGIGPNHDHEAAYVQSFVDLLPTPWRGFMMAGFAAAYMSTVATQLNWGASYLVNDVYRRFLRKDETQRHYVGDVAARDGRAVPVVDARHVAVVVGRRRVEIPAGDRRRNGPRSHPALVLVAHQRLVGDQLDAGVVRDLADLFQDRPRPVVPRGRSADRLGDHAHHGRREYGDLGFRHVHDGAGNGQRSRVVLRTRAPRRPGLGQGIHRPRLRPRVDSRWRFGVDELGGRHRRRVLVAVRDREDHFRRAGQRRVVVGARADRVQLDRPIVPQRSAAAGDGGS